MCFDLGALSLTLFFGFVIWFWSYLKTVFLHFNFFDDVMNPRRSLEMFLFLFFILTIAAHFAFVLTHFHTDMNKNKRIAKFHCNLWCIPPTVIMKTYLNDSPVMINVKHTQIETLIYAQSFDFMWYVVWGMRIAACPYD